MAIANDWRLIYDKEDDAVIFEPVSEGSIENIKMVLDNMLKDSLAGKA